MKNPLSLRSVTVLSFITLLSACGGGGGGSGIAASSGVLSEAETIERGYELINEYGDASPAASVPSSGIVTYDGVGAASPFASTPQGIIDNATSVYQLTANVDFSRNEFNARAYNFNATEPGYSIDGSLSASGDISGSDFDGTFSGTLVEEGVNVRYSGVIGGSFVGRNGKGMVGVGSGTATARGFGSQRFNTVWGAER